MDSDEPVCPKCGDMRHQERVFAPLWARKILYYCNVCSHTWTKSAEVQ